MNRKLCLFIAMSLDGFIAKPDGDIGFLNQVELEGEDYGYSEFIDTVDTVILGRKTYDKIRSMGVESPYGDRQVFVITRSARPDSGKIIFFSGKLADLVLSLKNQSGKNIYCDGGAETINHLLQESLIDEIIVSVIPILLGEGIRLFGQDFPEQKLQLVHSKSFEKGLVQLHYTRVGQVTI
jgi:dihydrofolate reductase